MSEYHFTCAHLENVERGRKFKRTISGRMKMHRLKHRIAFKRRAGMVDGQITLSSYICVCTSEKAVILFLFHFVPERLVVLRSIYMVLSFAVCHN